MKKLSLLFLLILLSIKVNAQLDLGLILEMQQYQMTMNLLNSIQKQAEQQEQEAENNPVTIVRVFPEANDRFSLVVITSKKARNVEIIRSEDDENWYKINVSSVLTGADSMSYIFTTTSVLPGDRVTVRDINNQKLMYTFTVPNKETAEYQNYINEQRQANRNFLSFMNSMNNGNAQTSTYSSTTSGAVCSLCHGTGFIDDEVPTYGQTGTKWCPGCNANVPLSHCHGCKVCPSCRGKGHY